MNLLDLTRGRHTYQVELSHSLLFETALGIAAATWPDIHSSLEKPPAYWERLKASLSDDLRAHLACVQQHNTWKTLLQLLHLRPFADLDDFLTLLREVDGEQLRYAALPFLGFALQEQRRLAAQGDEQAVPILAKACAGHKFLPAYIRYVCRVDLSWLRAHLHDVMRGWHESVVQPEAERIEAVLRRDSAAKQAMLASLEPEAFVEWATGGIRYSPEPTVTRVLLIPHTIYRPWNIQAEMEGTKIFYYPVADENLDAETDIYRPGIWLVQRYKALGDENRLRIVKLLFEKDRTLQELTDLLPLAKSTIHHHLTLLRSAQLVEADDQRYSLKRSALALLDAELRQYLERGR